jgi:hypothetical protein
MRKTFFAFLLFLSITSCYRKMSYPIETMSSSKSALTIPSVLPENTFHFKGVNWARPTTNYSWGTIVPSGLDSLDNYTVTLDKTDSILNQFVKFFPGVNTVRMPINEATVLGHWWSTYKGVIDKIRTKNMKVVLAFWCSPAKTHKVDDSLRFFQMWDTVVNAYKADSMIYYEVFNEPVGYNGDIDGLINLYNVFITQFETEIPKSRIILDGAGWGANIVPIGEAISDCLLSLHHYPGWGSGGTSDSAWEVNWRSKLSEFSKRTIVTEFGAVQTLKAGMTEPNDYTGPIVNKDIAYLVAGTNVFREDSVGSIYWCGLRLDSPNDYNSMLERVSAGSQQLRVRNPSAVARLRYGWGESAFDPNASYKFKNKNSNMNLDVTLSSTNEGAAIVQSNFWTRISQEWQVLDLGNGYTRIVNKKSKKDIHVPMASIADSVQLEQRSSTGSAAEEWAFEKISGTEYYKFVNRNSGKVMSVNTGLAANGANIIQIPFMGANSQQWEIIKQ